MSKQLEEKTLKELVVIYNEKVEEYGNVAEYTTVRTFKDKATAVKRIGIIQEALDENPVPTPKKKKKATTTKKKKPSQEEIDALLDGKKKPSKAKKKAKPASEGKPRGRKASFEYEAHPDGVAEPREGTLRADCLAMLEDGCTIDELEDKMREYRDSKGAKWKVSCRYRALEILKLLANQNGYGFTEKDDGKIHAFTA